MKNPPEQTAVHHNTAEVPADNSVCKVTPFKKERICQMKRIISIMLTVSILLASDLGGAEGILKLPDNLVEIEAEAFSGNSSLTTADVPYGTESISSRVFANSALQKIYIPNTVYYIAEDAFAGTDVLISAPDFSYAQMYAERNGFQWEDSGDHYPQNVALSSADILNSGFQVDDEKLLAPELLPTEGETDPERLKLIGEHNTLALEAREHIAICNDTSALVSAASEMNEVLDSFSFEEVGGSVGISFGSGQLVLDSSLYDRLQAGVSITDAELSEDGTQMILTAGNKQYYLYISGNTMRLSAADGTAAGTAMYRRRSADSFGDMIFYELDNYLAVISHFLTAIDYYNALNLEHLKPCFEIEQAIHECKWKLGLEEKGVYDARVGKLLSKIENLERWNVVLSKLSIPAQIYSGYSLIDKWKETKGIDAHEHPTENDLSPEARKASEKLKKAIVSLQYTYVIDAINTALGLTTSIATVASASALIEPKLPPMIKAFCAKLTGETALCKLISFGVDLGLNALEDKRHSTMLELDRSLHTTVSGKVYDAVTKMPLQYVSVFSGGDNIWTDSTGSYTIHLQPGKHTITFKRDNYQDHQITVTLESGEALQKDIELTTAEGTVIGVIRDSEFNTPLSNVTILCGDRMELSGYDGSYSISLPIGPQTITYLRDGYIEKTITLTVEENTRYVRDVWMEYKPLEPDAPETPSTDFLYSIYNGEVTIDGYIGSKTAVVIPGKIEGYPVTEIGDEAFDGCTSLTSVMIPRSVTVIGDEAFDGCTSLTSVMIPDSVTAIGDLAFRDCISMKNVTISDSMAVIGFGVFVNCHSLLSVTIPGSVTTIGNEAFRECGSLTSLTIPNSVEKIGDLAFSYCYNLTNVTIGNSVAEMGNEAFNNCHSLTSVTIPASMTKISHGAFGNCYSLTSVTIPDSVMAIGDYAFNDCDSLTSVTIPDSVAEIGYSAFGSCGNMKSVTIGNGVTFIGFSAFSNCNSLETAYVHNSYAASHFSDYDGVQVIRK